MAFSGMANENFDVNQGSTGASIFGNMDPVAKGGRPRPQTQNVMGDDYRPPPGLPEWKAPSYDEDDTVDPRRLAAEKGPNSGVLSRFFPDHVSQGLFMAKALYFLFFAAFGSLFPLMAVYFKQLGMDASQTGFLIGVRSLIEYIAGPFWKKITDRFQKGKLALLIAIGSWIVFTYPIGHIRPPVVSCKYYNGSMFLLKLPGVDRERPRRSVVALEEYSIDWPDVLTPDTVDELPMALPVSVSGQEEHYRYRRGAGDANWAPGYVVGTSPQTIEFTLGYNQQLHKEWVSPAFSNEVFEKEGVQKVFFLLLLLVIIGEFFSSPAIPLADAAVITLLGEEHADKYGSQRIFGSLGWGCTMFVMGMVLDHSHFEHSKCGMHDQQKNYHVCFIVFSVLMGLALLAASLIPFKYTGPAAFIDQNVPMQQMQANGPAGQKKPKELSQTEKMKEMASKTKVFANQLRAMPEFNAVFKAMANLRLLSFMLTAWVMGIGVGLIFTFLFWHLQEFGGGPTLFGIASVINHLSEMTAFFVAPKLVNRYGHVKLLAVGLLVNCGRFLYVSFITWPWFVLPFEFVQGITHATVWAACCSYITHNTEPELRPSAQGVLQFFYHSLGKFSGAVFGGMLIKKHGSGMVFRSYGILSAAFFGIFVLANFAQRDEGTAGAEGEGDETKVGADLHLAPHGVSGVSMAMPRALSSSKLDEQQPMMADPNQPTLGVPGAANNPFLADSAAYSATGSRLDSQQQQQQQQYYGRGYNQAQSGYSSSGFGLQ